MAIKIAVRGSSLNARYGNDGVTGSVFYRPGETAPAVISSVQSGLIGSNVIDVNSTSGQKAVYWRGFDNFSANSSWSILLRFYLSAFTVQHGFWMLGCPASPSHVRLEASGGNFRIFANDEFQDVHANNLTLGSAGGISASTVYDALVTHDGSVSSNAYKLYIDAALNGQGSPAAAFDTKTQSGGSARNQGLMPTIAVGRSESLRTQMFVEEFVAWDEVIDPTNVTLESGSGQLNGASRTSFVDVTAFDGTICDLPVESDVADGVIYDQGAKTGTLVAGQTLLANNDLSAQQLSGILEAQ